MSVQRDEAAALSWPLYRPDDCLTCNVCGEPFYDVESGYQLRRVTLADLLREVQQHVCEPDPATTKGLAELER